MSAADIRAALERLIEAVVSGTIADLRAAIAAARAALAEPVGEGPTDQELNQEWQQLMNAPEAILAEPMLAFARAVLARWGTPAAPPAPERATEDSSATASPAPEPGEVVAALKVIDKMQQEWVLIGNDDDGTASPSLSMPISLRRFTVLRDALTHAALFQHLSAPAPVVVAVGECPHCGYEGEMARVPQAGEGR
jgi:hypothetical protein